MNHIPKFLIPKKKRMSSDRTPKLERRFALRKNIHYEPPDAATCQSLRTRSLDLPPYNNNNNAATSFRLHGVDDGEIDLICQTLGLSPDDFAIPIASWEAHKARSASSVVEPRRFSGETATNTTRRSILDVTSEKRGENRLSNSSSDSVVSNYATRSNSDSVVNYATRSILEISDETATDNKARSVLDVTGDDMCGDRGEDRSSNSDSVFNCATRSNSEINDETTTNFEARSVFDVSNDDDLCNERGKGALGRKRGEKRLSNSDSVFNYATRSVLDVSSDNNIFKDGVRVHEEPITNNKTRSDLDITSEDLCSETLGEKCVRVSEEVVTNNDRFDVVNNTRLRSDVSSGDKYGERERETLGERRGFDLSNKFQDSVRVSDEIATNNDRFMATDPIDIDNTRSILNISSEDMYNDRYADGDRGGIKSVRTNLMAPPVSPMVVNDTSSMFDKASSDWELTGDFNNVGDNVTKFANVGSIGGIKGVRPPLLAPPPLISARVIDNTSSTWDIMRSFAPDSEENPSPVREKSSYYDDEEEREARPRGSAAFLSESCSFTTTSNDDDSSSTTTEPMSNISPNGRFKRVITYWEKGELLGRGSFGSVYEGIADGGYFIAVKEVSLLDQGDMGRQSIYQLEQEIALLSQFEHENIVQYYGTDKDEAHLYIFLELVTKGSLLSLYQKYHLRDSQVSSYTRQILHGLKYLHERNVVHRDIKCANILVGADGSVKLADFGLAKATKLNDVKSCKGTAFWMAPEVVRGRHQGYGLPADIWSLGCTVLEMLTHRIPYSPLECMPALFRIGRGEPPPIPDSLSRDARDFISRCLKVDPNDRPTATQLLEHSFVRRPLSTSSGSSSPYHSVGRGLNLSSR